MDRKQASELLEKQLPTIFAWSMAKSFGRSEGLDIYHKLKDII